MAESLRIQIDETGRKLYGCIGKSNTCDIVVDNAWQMCIDCRSSIGGIIVNAYANGDTFIRDGIKYVWKNGKEHKACINNGCNRHSLNNSQFCNQHKPADECSLVKIHDCKEIRNGVYYGRSSTATECRWYICCEFGNCVTLWQQSRVAELNIVGRKYCGKHARETRVATEFVNNNKDVVKQLSSMVDSTFTLMLYTKFARAFGTSEADSEKRAYDDFINAYRNYQYISAIVMAINDMYNIKHTFAVPNLDVSTVNDMIRNDLMKSTNQQKPAAKLVKPNFAGIDEYVANVVDELAANPDANAPIIRPYVGHVPDWAKGLVYVDGNKRRILGEIFVGKDGKRRIVSLGSGKYKDGTPKHVLRAKFVCNGLGDTCQADVKKDGKCNACLKGDDSLGALKRFLAANRVVGKRIMCPDGLRRFWDGTQTRTCCVGDNDTCENARETADNLCRHHTTGNMPHVRGYEKGDTVEHNGERRIHNGLQFVKLCQYGDDECDIPVAKNGMCKKHAIEWQCQYVNCESIRVNMTSYCAKHKDGVINKKAKYKMEVAVINWCEDNNVAYTAERRVDADGTLIADGAPPEAYNQPNYRFDFYLLEYGIYIECDGIQHFRSIDRWGGNEGLIRRQYIDDAKSRYAIKQGCSIIRIHDKDKRNINTFLTNTVGYLGSNPGSPPMMYLSPSYESERWYATIGREIECLIMRADGVIDDSYDNIDAMDEEEPDM